MFRITLAGLPLFAWPLLLALPLGRLHAESAPTRDQDSPAPTWQSAEWLIPEYSEVSRRHQTPLGYVYYFVPSPPHSFGPPESQKNEVEHPRKCRCRTCVARFSLTSLQCKIPGKFAKKRFVAIRFLLRQFPAAKHTPQTSLRYELFRSNQGEVGNDYYAINGSVFFSGSAPLFFRTIYAPISKQTFFFHGKALNYAPLFEPQNMAVIWDTNPTGTICIAVNHELFFINKNEFPKKSEMPIRTLGLLIQRDANAPPWNVLELSTPQITGFDEPPTILQVLSRRRFDPYPYDRLLAEKRGNSKTTSIHRIRTDKNPDLWYIAARNLLYGTADDFVCDPATAIDLLQKAAKAGHVPARYELAVCYWRGYGVRQDTAKALELLQERPPAPKSKIPGAETSAETMNRIGPVYSTGRIQELKGWFRLMRNRHLPFFYESTANGILQPYSEDRHDSAAWGTLFGYAGYRSPEYSPRHLPLLGFTRGAAGIQPEQPAPRPIISPYGELAIPERRYALSPNDLKAEAKKGYPPALYAYCGYLDRLARQGKIKVDEVELMQMLRQAENGGHEWARLFRMRIQARRGESNAADFTASNDFLYADDPIYWVLKIAETQPRLPGLPEYLRGQIPQARELAKNGHSAESEYLAAVILFNESPAISVSPATAQVYRLEGIERLEKAAAGGHAQAQYYLGRFLLGIPDTGIPDAPWRRDEARGEALLRHAMNQGHLKARYLLAERQLPTNPALALKMLQPLVAADIGPALLLQAKIQLQLQRPEAALASYQQAARLGEPVALSELALRAKTPEEQKKAWQLFMKTDLRQRLNSAWDFYYPTFERRLPLYDYDFTPRSNPPMPILPSPHLGFSAGKPGQ